MAEGPATSSATGESAHPLRIFLNYRREDTRGDAGRLYDDLVERFGEENVFRDVDTLEAGEDFDVAIKQAVDACDVLIALVGQRWLTVTEANGRRRIDNPDDFVRLEIQAALEGSVRIVPVRVEGAEMPDSDELPKELARFAKKHALEISDSRWRHDRDRLIRSLEQIDADPHGAAAAERKVARGGAGDRTKAAWLAIRATPRWLVVIAAAAVALLIGAISLTGGGEERVAGQTISVGDSPKGIVVGEGGVWVAHRDTVTHVDPSSGKVLRQIRLAPVVDAIAVGQGGLWGANGSQNTVTHIDTRSGNAVEHAIRGGKGALKIAVGEGGVWVSRFFDSTVTRIDPSSGKVVGLPIRVTSNPTAIAAGQGGVWVLHSETVDRIDPRSARVVAHIGINCCAAEAIAVGRGGVWVVAGPAPHPPYSTNIVTHIDPSSNKVVGQPTRVGKSDWGIAVGHGGVWVSSSDNTVTHIDLGSGKVVGGPIRVGKLPSSIAAGQGGVWVANQEDGTVSRIQP